MVETLEGLLDRPEFRAAYSVQRALGRGAYGQVYLARQNSLNRLVAVKFLDPRRSSQSHEDAARFARELKLLAALSHPNVLKVFDAGVLGDRPYFVTEYVDGTDLGRRLASGPLAPSEASRICLAAASALEYLHEQQILHRDLKPDNILLGRDGSVMVSDFGLARPFETDRKLTVDGTIVGTPAFMPPEAIGAGQVVAAGDIYAFGLVLYLCFDGELPFDGRLDPALLLQLKVEQDVRPPRPHVERRLASLMAACVSRAPDRRPTARQLRQFFAGAGKSAKAPPGRDALGTQVVVRPPARRWPVAAGVTALLAAGSMAWMLRPQELPRAPVQQAAVAPRTRLEAKDLVALHETLGAGRVEEALVSGGLTAHQTLSRLESCGAGPLARRIAASEGELAPGEIPAAQLADIFDSLHLLRLAECRFRIGGSDLPAEFAGLAGRTLPLLTSKPPGALPVVGVVGGDPVTVPSEAEVALGLPGEGYAMKQLPDLVPRWRAQGARRLWWVVDVRGLLPSHVLYLRVPWRQRTLRFAMIAPARSAGASYNGRLALGFDSRLMEEAAPRVLFSYLPMDRKARGGPVLAELGIWE